MFPCVFLERASVAATGCSSAALLSALLLAGGVGCGRPSWVVVQLAGSFSAPHTPSPPLPLYYVTSITIIQMSRQNTLMHKLLLHFLFLLWPSNECNSNKSHPINLAQNNPLNPSFIILTNVWRTAVFKWSLSKKDLNIWSGTGTYAHSFTNTPPL